MFKRCTQKLPRRLKNTTVVFFQSQVNDTQTRVNVDTCHVILPAVGQVEGDAAANVGAKAYIADGAQADVEEGDDAHSQVKDQGETLWPVHLVLQREDLETTATIACQPISCVCMM